MAHHFIFHIDHVPGALAEITEILGDAGINVEGVSAASLNDKAIVQILTNHIEDAKAALDQAKVPYTQKPVLLLKMKDSPGQLAKLSRALANSGVNITSFYVTMKGQEVLAAEPFEKAEAIAKELRML